MADVTVLPIPAEGQIRLNINFADLPDVQYVDIIRTHADGSEHEVRPFPAPLSGGAAVVYDVEAPLDADVSYRVYPRPYPAARVTGGTGVGGRVAATVRPVFSDTFTRVVAAGSWGATTPGAYAWTIAAGVAANFSVNGTQGVIDVSTRNAQRIAQNLTDFNHHNVQGLVQFVIPAVSTGNVTEFAYRTRWGGSDASPHFILLVSTETTGVVTLRITTVTGGVNVILDTAASASVYGAGTIMNLRFVQVDDYVYAKVWRSVDAEPALPQAGVQTSTNAALTGGVAVSTILNNANTNALPYNARFDNLTVTSLDTADTVSVPSTVDGVDGGWLKDPLRPANDQRLVFCPPLECPSAPGIILSSLAAETYAADSARFPVQDRRRPVVVYSRRKDLVGSLRLVSVTCDDRDALLVLLEPGSPLLLQLPAEYCWPDRYLDIGDVSVFALSSDLRRQIRGFDMPFAVVDSPSLIDEGEGVSGTRWMDLCENYSTWDGIDAGGFTGIDVLNGLATL